MSHAFKRLICFSATTIGLSCTLINRNSKEPQKLYESHFRKADHKDKILLEGYFQIQEKYRNSRSYISLLSVNQQVYNPNETIKVKSNHGSFFLNMGYRIKTYILNIEQKIHKQSSSMVHSYLQDGIKTISESVKGVNTNDIRTLCLFESYLWSNEYTASNLTAFGIPINHNFELKNLTQNTIISSLFEIEAKQDISNHRKACEKIYKNDFKNEAKYYLQSVSKNIRKNRPIVQCLVETKENKQKLTYTSPRGDPSCLTWFGLQDESSQSFGVARCIPSSEGSTIGTCQMRSKSHFPVLLLRGRNGEILTFKTPHAKLVSSPDIIAFACDETIHSSLKITQNGGQLFSYEGYCTPPLLYNSGPKKPYGRLPVPP